MSLSPPVVIFLLIVPRWCFFCGAFLLCVFLVCLRYTGLYFHYSLVVTCWERAVLLALFCVKFSCVVVILSYGILGQVSYLIVSILDRCLISYYVNLKKIWYGKIHRQNTNLCHQEKESMH